MLPYVELWTHIEVTLSLLGSKFKQYADGFYTLYQDAGFIISRMVALSWVLYKKIFKDFSEYISGLNFEPLSGPPY